MNDDLFLPSSDLQTQVRHNLTCKQGLGIMIVIIVAAAVSTVAIYLKFFREDIGVDLDTKMEQSRVETATQKLGIMQYDKKLTGTIAINDQGK